MALATGPAGAWSLPELSLPELEVPRPVAVGIDLAVVRPLGLVETAVGAVFFVPMALLTAPQGREGIQQAWETQVVEPAENVFQRPLAEF